MAVRTDPHVRGLHKPGEFRARELVALIRVLDQGRSLRQGAL
jgi:hypothetical protein